jgi:trk system potassium uptake protein TrkA
MKIAVVGLGQFGRSLATRLGRAGMEVIAVDSNLERVDDVKDEVSLAVKLDATDENDLKSQGLHEVDVLVAAIKENFEANELVVVLAKRMHVPRVVALASSPMHARILRLIGADEVILPMEEAVDRLFMRMLQPSLRNILQLVPGYTIAEIEAPKEFIGKTLKELQVRTRYGVSVIGIMKKGYRKDAPKKELMNLVPGPDAELQAGDTLMIAGDDASVQKLVNEI